MANALDCKAEYYCYHSEWQRGDNSRCIATFINRDM